MLLSWMALDGIARSGWTYTQEDWSWPPPEPPLAQSWASAVAVVFLALMFLAAAIVLLHHRWGQAVEMAMALAPEPRLLLLDEPTAGMSLEERRVTSELLIPVKRRCSLVIVEHDLDFIRDICDVLTVLDQGNVLESGTVAQVHNSRKVQEVYLTRV